MSWIPEQDDPIGKLSRLGGRDRSAVMQLLSQEERSRIEPALRERHLQEEIERERQLRTDRQFLGYSAWLAPLIEVAEQSVANGLTETASRALWNVHADQLAARAPVSRAGLVGQLYRIVDWFAPIRKDGQ